MKTVKINKADLLDAIKFNRKKHQNEVLEAIKAYKQKALNEYQEAIKLLQDTNKVSRINLQEPVDKRDDYDRVIKMLEMSADAVIELDSHEFDQYVMDNWEWKNHAIFANSTYISK